MRLVRCLLALCLLLTPAIAWPQPAAQERSRVVVELFTSQGCASCPRANGLLGELARQPDVVALTFPVDYWDYLGWRDTFAQSEFTSRQRAYSRSLRRHVLYTPQIVINGAFNANAARPNRVAEALTRARREAALDGPAIHIAADGDDEATVQIGRGGAPREPAEIWVATYLPGPVNVLVTAGENAGHRVGHYNLVRHFTRLGAWNGAAARFEDVPCRPACAVLIQAPRTGRVLAAARLDRDADD